MQKQSPGGVFQKNDVALLEKRLRLRYFPEGFAKCFRSYFFAENLQATASVHSFSEVIEFCDCSSQMFLPFQYIRTKLYIDWIITTVHGEKWNFLQLQVLI